MKFFKKNWLVLLIIVVIFISRFSLFNKDAREFWADERQYKILINAIDESVLKADYSLPVKTIFRLQGRPAFGLFYFPVAFLEWKNPEIPFGSYFNLIVNTCNLILIYLIVTSVLNRRAGLFAAFLVALTNASGIYMRHLIPYDLALFFLLAGLFFYKISKKVFILGFFSGISFLTYPGQYFYLLPIPLALAWYHRSLKPPILFSISLISILIFTQVTSIAIGESTSYFRSLQNESPAVSIGEYMPAYSYIVEYIFTLDGIWNLLLILASFVLIIFQKKEKKITTLGIYILAVFLVMEVSSHIIKTHVLYGRTVRSLYLALIIFSALVIERTIEKNCRGNKRVYFIIFAILLAVSLLNGLPRFLIYKNIIYPKQFQQRARNYLNSKIDRYEIEDALFVNYWDIGNPDAKLKWHFFKPGKKGKYYTMNAIQTYPYYGNYNMDEFCKHDVLLKEPHIQYTFRPYLFEGHKRGMRERMEKDPLFYELIYCKEK